MAILTIVFGAMLIGLGGAVYLDLPPDPNTSFPHSLIPVLFGVLLALTGIVALTPDTKRRMIAMHAAVTLGLLGFLGTIPGLIATLRRAAGQVVLKPTVNAAIVQTIMSVICLVFVLLCVRSFIAARKARQAQA